jgi:hypothetical protein
LDFLRKFGIVKSMGVRFGNWDVLQLTFNVMNALMKKGAITYDEAREILNGALPPEMSQEEKNRILDSMIRRNPPQ